MASRLKEIYEFGRFRLDVAERKLLRGGKPVSLSDKAFDTLCVLVRRAGELVTKDVLIEAVWPDSIVEENNLDQKILMIRRAVGEKARGKEKFVETIRGHGYRFVAPVRIVEDITEIQDSPGVDAAASDGSPSRVVVHSPVATHREGNVIALAKWLKREPIDSFRLREEQLQPREGPASNELSPVANASTVRGRLLQLAVVSVVIGVLVYLVWSAGLFPIGTPGSGAVIESIAVLPFVNETGNPGNDFLSDGLTESLIGSLSQIPGLSVKSRNSVFRYKGREIDASVVALELSVSGVLLGRFIQRDDDLMLGLELVDARTGNVVWAERYNRKSSEIVSLQSEIARDVSNKLRSRLSSADQDRITRVYTADAEANRLYLQGMYHLNKRSAEDIRKSIELFEQATSKDSSYAKAYAGIAMSYLILPDYSHGLSRDELRACDQRFREAFQKAYAADSDLPDSVLLSAAVKDVDWDVAGADAEYQRAIELDPNFATPRHWYSRFLGGLGKYEEALVQINKARELDPYSRSIAFNVGGRLADARRFDEAIAQYKRVLEMEPDHPLTHFALALAHDAKGNYKEAISEYQISDVLLEKESDEEASLKAHALNIALEKGGARGYWQKRLEFSRRDKERGVGSDYNIATCLARLELYDEALEKLEESLRRREPGIFWIKTESAFDPISNIPRFRNILLQIGLPM